MTTKRKENLNQNTEHNKIAIVINNNNGNFLTR